MSRQAHERKHHRWTSQILHEIEAQLHQVFTGPTRTRSCSRSWQTDPQAPSDRGLGEPDKTSASGPHQRSRTAALSGSHPKAPGSAGGYLHHLVARNAAIRGLRLFDPLIAVYHSILVERRLACPRSARLQSPVALV
jgi:hypothetical protein